MRSQIVFILSIMWTSLLFSDDNRSETGLAMMDLVIEAPSDTTIAATMPGCWGMVMLDTAEVISHLCGGPITWQVETPFDTINTNGGKLSFRLGTHEVRFIAMDQCNNIARDTMNVTVIDSIPPIAQCVDFRTISLDGSGMAFIPARVFDGGSEESCFTWFKVRRLLADTNCVDPSNPDNLFNDNVKFCCTDIGDTIEVILKVYDRMPNAGPVPLDALDDHADTCIARAIVLDKAPPILVCPEDITIECGDHIDFDTLGLPTYTDNCDSIRFESFIERDIDQCGTGEFRRFIVGIDAGGQRDTCVQTITVVNNNPFDGTDNTQLKWPEAFVMVFHCLPIPDTSITGYPEIFEDQCAMVSVTYTDEVYQFSRDACSKVIRKWKAIDWCQYDPKVNSSCIPSNGCWTFDQIIKVVDTISPVISRPTDTIVPYLQAGCDSTFVNLDSATTDRCYPEEEVVLSVEIDLFRDGGIDRIVGNGDASGFYPIGEHWVIYLATDACGNTTRDSMSLIVKDRTLPTPIAKVGLNTSVIDMGGGMIMVSVTADQLNASSYDNCTDENDLKFSFSADTNDTERIYDCDSIGSRGFELWVTDECGNQDFASGILLIQDNQDICPTTSSLPTISGLVKRSDGMALNDVNVALLQNNNPMSSVLTNATGGYLHPKLRQGGHYQLQPVKTDAIESGLSTKDLIFIQRFLLGQVEYTEVYQHLVSDVDKSGFISVRDITELRKVLLGRQASLAHGQSWIFIANNYKFRDAANPLDEYWPETFSVGNLTDHVLVNFTGYKLGDVDMSFGLTKNQTRSTISLEKEYASDQLSLQMNQEMWINGFQMELEVQGVDLDHISISSEVEDFGPNNYHVLPNGRIKVVWYSKGDQIWMDEGASLIKLSALGEELQGNIVHDGLSAELYDDESVYALATTTPILNNSLELVAVPNPFAEETTLRIYVSEDEQGQLAIRNILGQEVFKLHPNLEKGWNEIQVNSETFQNQGIYFIDLRTSQGRSEIKVVRGQ